MKKGWKSNSIFLYLIFFFKHGHLNSSSSDVNDGPIAVHGDLQIDTPDKRPPKVDSKCSSRFFTFFYHSPTHNLAWCKVFFTLSIKTTPSAPPMVLTILYKVPKAGSSTWVENFLLLANETEASIANMVGGFMFDIFDLFDIFLAHCSHNRTLTSSTRRCALTIPN